MSDRSTTFPKTQYDLLQENERAIRDATRRRQGDDHATRVAANLDGQVQAAIARGVQPGRLPRIRPNMSPADVAEAQAHLNEASGMSPTQARDPAMIRSQLLPAGGVGSRTGIPLPARADTVPANSPMAGLPPVAEARARLTANAIRTGGPTPEMNEARAAAAKEAGTGKVVQTPYGPASSTMARPGASARDIVGTRKFGDPTTDADTGVQHLTWQQQVLKDHPEIGTAGSSANEAFVKAYKDSQAADWKGEKDPVQLAHNTVADVRANEQRISDEERADALRPSPVAPPRPLADAVASAAAQNVRETGRGVYSMLDENVISPVANAITGARNFWNDVTGSPTRLPYRTPYHAPATDGAGVGGAIGATVVDLARRYYHLPAYDGSHPAAPAPVAAATSAATPDAAPAALPLPPTSAPAPVAQSPAAAPIAPQPLLPRGAPAPPTQSPQIPLASEDGDPSDHNSIAGMKAEIASQLASSFLRQPENHGAIRSQYNMLNGVLKQRGRPIMPVPDHPAFSPDSVMGVPAPTAPNPTTGTPATPASPPLSQWTPDADTQAFAQNPADDEFRKRLREPSQLSYAA